jgi:hypothetical protein
LTDIQLRIEQQKEALIEHLISHGIFKTRDERHLYDVPLNVLEKEYEKWILGK